MNNTKKLNMHKKVLQDVCKKFDGPEEFIRDKLKSIVIMKNYLWKR